MKKQLSIIVGVIFFISLLPTSPVTAEGSVEQACNYTLEEGVNPPYQTVNCLLTEMALEYNIPPEIVKGIATKENGEWKQFNDDGTPVRSDDGGIGLMQVTNYQHYDIETLENDIIYNIRAGVEILDSMFNRIDLPSVNSHSREIIEHWYFPVMAYNGIKPRNSPIVQETGERNVLAYQEQVFSIIENQNKFDLTQLPFIREDFDYDPDSTENIKFVTMEYSTEEPMHYSKHLFKQGNQAIVSTDGLSLRMSPTTESERIASLQVDERVTVTGRFTYDQSAVTKPNQFVWIPIQREDGSQGYVASGYLNFKPLPPFISDISENQSVIAGTGESGDRILLKVDDQTLSSAYVEEDGTFELLIDPMEAGTELVFIAKDTAGNVSEPVTKVILEAPEPQIIDLYTLTNASKHAGDEIEQLINRYGKQE